MNYTYFDSPNKFAVSAQIMLFEIDYRIEIHYMDTGASSDHATQIGLENDSTTNYILEEGPFQFTTFALAFSFDPLAPTGCPHLVLTHGTVGLTKGTISGILYSAVFQCDATYTLSGASSMTCFSNNQWNDGSTMPTCNVRTDACFSSPCLHGGVCTSSSLLSYTCDCTTIDFYGPSCQYSLPAADVALVYPFTGQTNIPSGPFYFRWVISLTDFPLSTYVNLQANIHSKDLFGSQITISLFDHANWRQWMLGQILADPDTYRSTCICSDFCFPSQNLYSSQTGQCSVAVSSSLPVSARKIYIAIENLDIGYDHIEYTISAVSTGRSSSASSVLPQILVYSILGLTLLTSLL